MISYLVGPLLVAALGTAANAQEADRVSLLAADSAQLAAVRAGDVAAIRTFMHEDYRVNAANNVVLSRAEVLSMFDRGLIVAEAVERSVETVHVSGDVGLVMGAETMAVPSTNADRTGPAQRQHRRFTNVYRFVDGRWWFLARHFNAIPLPPANGAD